MSVRSADISLEEFGTRFIALFPRLVREMARYEKNELSEGRITPHQMLVLAFLDDRGPCQMNDLANVLKLHCSTVTGLVDRLFARKLVQRIRHEGDRRAVQVSLSTKGRGVLRKVYQQKQQGIMQLFSHLSARERATYLHLLEKIMQALARGADNS